MRMYKICPPHCSPLLVLALAVCTLITTSSSLPTPDNVEVQGAESPGLKTSGDNEVFKRASPGISEPQRKTKLDLLQDVLFAFEKGLSFFKGDYSAINVDGLFGIRLAQGSLHGALKDCYSRKLDCPQDLIKKLEQFVLTIDYVSKLAEPYIEAQDPSYFQRFYDAIGGEFSLDYRPELLVEGRRVNKTGLKYDEEKGDACLNMLSGTGRDRGRPVPKCTITDKCWEFMTTPDLDDYFITHQLLYFIFIDKHDCLEEARRFDPDNDPNVLRKQERKFCRNILGELRGEFNHEYSNVDIQNQDLFLEQTLLCGMLGFEDFFADNYITMVLSWQYPVGCFSMSPKLLEDMVDPQARGLAISRLLKSLRKEADDIRHAPAPVGTSRKLMREMEMDGQCLAHKTGLGFGTLGTYLRYLMDVVYSVTPHEPARLA